jgi:hypothetical protein
MSVGARPKLRDDEFTGMTYQDAAKNYLERVGHAVSMEELLAALRDGGCPVGGINPKKTLYVFSPLRKVHTSVRRLHLLRPGEPPQGRGPAGL